MGKKLKKGTSGSAVQYLTRNQALKKLQVRLSEFRRLCILKGVHPREPKKKKQGQNKTYYHIKDIAFLAHEPLLNKYREAAVHERKIRKARAKRNNDLARRLLARKPTFRLDHLVKERYPSFVDALRDLDDALTLIHLFATLPAEQRHRIPNTAVHTSRRLALEWQAYIVRTSSLRKTFVSVKGFYYQAEVMGQPITWLVPHQLSQVLPADVDYRVMLTFLDFYQTLVQFVNFKLYNMVGVRYPPVVDPRMEQAAAGLASIMEELARPAEVEAILPAGEEAGADAGLDAEAASCLQGLQDKLHDLQQEGAAELADAPDSEHMPAADADKATSLPQTREADLDDKAPAGEPGTSVQDAETSGLASNTVAGVAGQSTSFAEARKIVGGAIEGDDEAEVCATLFRGMAFFLGREVPREQLLVVIRSFGGIAGWDGEGSPFQDQDECITHQVVDRPTVANQLPGREYVQPQWVVDSANFRVLVDARLYAPGIAPPPHLSPFVDADEEEYVPEYAVTLQRLQESAKAVRQRARGMAVDAAFLEEAPAAAAEQGPDLAAVERVYKAELDKEIGAKRKREDESAAEEDMEDLAAGTQQPAMAINHGKEDATEADAVVMNKAVMKRKDRHLYQAILNRQKAKRQKVEKLENRRAALSQATD